MGISENNALTSEQLASIQKNVANWLAYRYLTSSCDSAEAADAFDGLRALCFAAKGNLFIRPTESERRTQPGKTSHWVTREAIEDILLELLAPYHGWTEVEIFKAIQGNKFRYIGRNVRILLIDRIRSRNAPKNKDVPTISMEQGLSTGETLKVADTLASPETALDGNQTSARQDTNNRYAQFVGENAKALREIGKETATLIDAAIGLYPRTYEGGCGQIKSALTRALQRRQDIAERTAREQKAKACEQIQKATADGSKVLTDLYGLIAKGDDEHTLRETYPSPDGKRRRHVVIRHVRFGSKRCKV